MNELIKKISSYDILNNLLPGAIFCHIIKYFIDFNLLSDNAVDNLFIYYFFGIIISRIGSLIVEPLYKKIKPQAFADYADYVLASKTDKKIEIFSETNNMYRTILALLIVIACTQVCFLMAMFTTMLAELFPYIMVSILIVLFLFAYIKQTKLIKKRVGLALKEEK